MLRLNKKTEYALLALRLLDQAPDDPTLVTARAIAQRYRIPEMLLAKVLQRMKKQGLVSAAKGSGGGYRLARSLSEVPLLDVLTLFDGVATLVECQDGHSDCQQLASCDIKGPLAVLNRAILEPLERMTIADLFVGSGQALQLLSRRPSPFLLARS